MPLARWNSKIESNYEWLFYNVIEVLIIYLAAVYPGNKAASWWTNGKYQTKGYKEAAAREAWSYKPDMKPSITAK